MSIIISENGKKAEKIDKTIIKEEDYLQNYIYENPESIPVYEIEKDKRLFVVAREFPTASGPIDALAIDQDGDIYVVETKLYTNSDKRKVVAQALDYGASLWRHSDINEFVSTITTAIEKKFRISFEDKIKDFFKIDDDEIDSILDGIRNNFQQGRIKFVILMNTIDERLKDLIVYINQNSQFDIYAVQMEYYKFEQYEIMIPKLFGSEVKKNVGSRSTSNWDRQKFFDDAKEKNDVNALKKLYELYDFIAENPLSEFGKGVEKGSFTFKIEDDRAKRDKVSIFALRTIGSIQFKFGHIKRNIGEENLRLYFDKLKAILPPQLWTERILEKSKPSFSLNDLFKNVEMLKRFEEATSEYIKEIKK